MKRKGKDGTDKKKVKERVSKDDRIKVRNSGRKNK